MILCYRTCSSASRLILSERCFLELHENNTHLYLRYEYCLLRAEERLFKPKLHQKRKLLFDGNSHHMMPFLQAGI